MMWTTPRADLYALISGFTGRLPDTSVATLRSSLVMDDPETVLEMLVGVLARGRVTLTEQERELTGRICGAHHVDAGPIGRAPSGPVDPLQCVFLPLDLLDEHADALDEIAILAAVGAAAEPDGDQTNVAPEPPWPARAMWRVTRSQTRSTVDIRLVEIDRDADPSLISHRIQEGLAESGEAPPRVEVFKEGAALTMYQEQALAAAALVWVAELPVIPQLAPVFDGANPKTGPFFSPEHPAVTDADRYQLLNMLRGGGEQLLGSLGWLDDVVTGQPRCVPVGYRSDGPWVWSDASLYYLERHGLAPDTDLCTHLRANPAPPHPLTQLQRHLALQTLTSPDPDEDTAREPAGGGGP